MNNNDANKKTINVIIYINKMMKTVAQDNCTLKADTQRDRNTTPLNVAPQRIDDLGDR